ncbi:DUF2624 domain-containing protein [Halalkalibacterium halodurans]|jgi:hypothetical protein|uniref:BH1387 protein n=2 Tax=Halalkalibacterium halodurans TaxID=86665 RepID=Q9KD32_HALH5|nr:DUF2624 domain-containing protein [Halalkalibacterium halodurans]MDY7221911.1 DUF2624 domain-containing protein [Halalkalibacterium halodurans]MDY7241187.1 DUF2624 domain-containing protein [Halalkalibacterium halodurans]MED3646482.1 DUF2624 domain-containing protein [Halalkalibacterium halodurans]MED4081783.1 DUF2624 domain-containing protein [Halalkalibacterium halodurans]MED4087047.1 DUF2624 domain-containing protein [Halalkalibacterium halodurans]
MNPFMIQMVNQKLNSLTAPELLQLAKQYGIPLTGNQAKDVIAILRSESVDVGNEAQVKRLIERLQQETDPQLAQTINQLLTQFSHLLP